MPSTPPLFHKVDSLQLPVPTLDAGLAFYQDALAHQLLWRTEQAAGLGMPDSETEIVVQTERPSPRSISWWSRWSWPPNGSWPQAERCWPGRARSRSVGW